MDFKSIELQNFKSYGNVPTKIEFTVGRGELILLVGKNGAGKTTIADGLSYAWFNTVHGRQGKRIPLAKLPNRLNGDMQVKVEFATPEVSHGVVTRRASPSKVTIEEDGVKYDKAGRVADRLQSHMQFDMDSFRSFISMSINDFKNFVELSTEDKRLLLDKMFNLEVVNQLGKIVKEMKKANDQALSAAGTEAATVEREMQRIMDHIEHATQRQERAAAVEVEKVREEMLVLQEKICVAKQGMQTSTQGAEEHQGALDILQGKAQEAEYKRRDAAKSLALYEGGKCPTCSTDLTTGDHSAHIEQLRARLEKIVSIQEKIASSIRGQQAMMRECQKFVSMMQEDLSQATAAMRMLQHKLQAEANREADEAKADEARTAAEEMRLMLDGMEERKVAAEDSRNKAAKQDLVYKRMATMFSEDGIKQSIITNIVRPLNAFIAENMAICGLPHKVLLDRAFDAKILHLGNEVDPETLSTGEAKIVNICIMLAYVKLIRTKRHVNLLFLDEVFASIDGENIYAILNLLRDFARQYSINVFLIHHSELQDSYFDRIIKISKNVFSQVEDTRRQ